VSVESIRKQIEGHTTIQEKVPASVDLPLSNECKRVLAYAAEEAERLSHKHIGTEHLLLGLLREEKCFAAEILHERGVRLASAREEISRIRGERAQQPSLLTQFSADLSNATGQLQALVGREDELEQLIQILCRFTRKNPVLVGEPGVGKKTIIGGLARRIADGDIPTVLAEKSIVALDLSPFSAIEKDRFWLEEFQNASAAEEGTIFFVDELHMPTSTISEIYIEALLKQPLVSGKIQCISTATPSGYSKSIENHSWLEQHFLALQVTPASEADAIKVLLGIKDSYERFHGVTYAEDALTSAVYYSSRIKGRHLPAKAVDLIDDAGARVKLRQTSLPEEVTEVQKRIRFIDHRMANSIANHEFEKARFYSGEQRKERENLRMLREKHKLDEMAIGTVTREDIEQVVARWTGLSVGSIRQSCPGDLDGLKEPGV
jgi:ATP-dependent Clp protease ATP-binding subunit ClpC